MGYKKIGSGYFAKNERKTTEKQPDYVGKGTVEGKKVQVGAWIAENDKGKYIKFTLSVKDENEMGQKPEKKEDLEWI